MISLPEQLLQEVDTLVAQEQSSRSEFIRQAMKLFILERKKRHIRETMQEGYQAMARINLGISSEAFQAEDDAEDTLGQLVNGV
jgi:CopG family transcriptional regulator/antitoxin EndoAI